MLYVFRCWDVSTPAVAAHSQSLFQTGWFVESLLTQTLIIHVIRTNKIPFLQSRASGLLTATIRSRHGDRSRDPVLAGGPLSGLHDACRASTGPSWLSPSRPTCFSRRG